MKNRKLALVEVVSTENDKPCRLFRVERMTNTIEWQIGQLLDEKHIDDILCRVGNREITIEIKGE